MKWKDNDPRYEHGSLGFPWMIDLLADGLTVGECSIAHRTITPLEAARSTFQGLQTTVGTYATLHVGGVFMMSDTLTERLTNRYLLRKAHGEVLIGGLGMGMVLHGMAKKAKRVTVIERSQDCIDLIGPSLPGNVEIIHADVMEWKPPKGQMWDCIYFDIWPTIDTDNLPEMTKLHRRFAMRKPVTGWMGSWMQEELRDMRRREKRGYY
jgi:hypothetical protein